MKTLYRVLFLLVALGAVSVRGQTPAPLPGAPAPLELVASVDKQPTGIAVSKTGRVFACFPDWSDGHTYSVAELKPNQPPQPYPSEAWNDPTAATTNPSRHFVCVQSVVVDAHDKLWVLDPASPRFSGSVTGAKLVKIDLATDKVEKIYTFSDDVLPPKSYLNDVRIDLTHHFAYISESGIGSIIVLNLDTGTARRVLANSPETKATPGFTLKVGDDTLTTSDGHLFEINCDGIALDSSDTWVYFEAPTNGKLYRVATVDLRNTALSEADLRQRLALIADIGVADGLLCGPDGNIYATSVVDHSVKRFDPAAPAPFGIVANDPRLVWPDSLALTQDGWIYVTASQIPRMGRFHQGEEQTTRPFQIFRFRAAGSI